MDNLDRAAYRTVVLSPGSHSHALVSAARPSTSKVASLGLFLPVFLILMLAFIAPPFGAAQTPADSVTVTFLAHQPAAPTVYVPGEFNGWTLTAVSQMTYSSGLAAWYKTYTFKTHATGGALGDSVLQYKFNNGGWYSDPLNSELNPLDNNNSVLRLTKLFWFEYYGLESLSQLTRISATLAHSNDLHITSVIFRTGATQNSLLTSTDVTAGYDTTTRVLDFTSGLPVPKTNYVRLVAYTSAGDSIVFSKGGYSVVVSPMPAYAKHGVTLPSPASNDSVTFRLRVAGKDYILVRIAPAGQLLSNAPAVVMRKAPNPADWWVNVKLAPGNYEYVYEIENGRQITDPWGRYSGTYGSLFTVGPEGLTADNYVWHSTAYQRPPLNKLVIYELNVGEVAGGYFGLAAGQAKFSDLAKLLPYFDSLGVNALELMPITDYEGIGLSGFSWGYDLSSEFAIEPAYGTPAMFKALVDSAHAHGIAIILDVVYGNLNDPGALWQMQPDEVANPYFKLASDLRPNEDGMTYFHDMDHWTPETQELVLTAQRMWIDEYKVDGFRYDYTQGIGWSATDTVNGILGWSNKISEIYGGAVYQIAEHLPESPALLYYSGLTGGWHDSFHDKIFDEARFKTTTLTDLDDLILGLGAFPGNDVPAFPARYANRTEPVNATVDHDEQSLIYEMTTFHSVPLAEALVRDRLYATFMFTSLGIPMLWEGMEISTSRGWTNDSEKLSYRPVDWSLAPTARGQTHYRYYRSLIQQRTHNPALTSGAYQILQRNDAQKVMAWKIDDQASGSVVVTVANLSGADQTMSNIAWPGNGTWYDVFDQSTLAVSDSLLGSISLPPYTARVFTNRSDSALGIMTGVADEPSILPSAFHLAQNYPNPFNSTTQFVVDVARAGELTLGIYNILGEEIDRITTGRLEPGTHTFSWDASVHPSGVYLYRLSSAFFQASGKMILLR